jgi:hypothetical protein
MFVNGGSEWTSQPARCDVTHVASVSHQKIARSKRFVIYVTVCTDSGKRDDRETDGPASSERHHPDQFRRSDDVAELGQVV